MVYGAGGEWIGGVHTTDWFGEEEVVEDRFDLGSRKLGSYFRSLIKSYMVYFHLIVYMETVTLFV